MRDVRARCLGVPLKDVLPKQSQDADSRSLRDVQATNAQNQYQTKGALLKWLQNSVAQGTPQEVLPERSQNAPWGRCKEMGATKTEKRYQTKGALLEGLAHAVGKVERKGSGCRQEASPKRSQNADLRLCESVQATISGKRHPNQGVAPKVAPEFCWRGGV